MKQTLIGQAWVCLATTVLMLTLAAGQTRADLFTSVDHLATWTATRRHKIIELMDQKVDNYWARIEKLKQLKRHFIRVLDSGDLDYGQDDADRFNNTATKSTTTTTRDEDTKIRQKRVKALSETQLSHPVGAFIALSRLITELSEVRFLVEEEGTPFGVATELDMLISEVDLPTLEDVAGCGEALLRLQKFYGLNTRDLADGKIIYENRTFVAEPDLAMEFEELFMLGRLAADDGDYTFGLGWFGLALEEAHRRKFHKSKEETEMNAYKHLLDYMSYTAYKDNQMEYAAKLTNFWLAVDPFSEKAHKNLDYYLSTIKEQEEERKKTGFFKVPQTKSGRQMMDERIGVGYSAMCRRRADQSPHSLKNYTKCLKMTGNWTEVMGMRVEILHEEPRVLRIHNIITESESEQLRKDSIPRLYDSNVGDGAGFKTRTDVRVAKTAWFRDRESAIAVRLKQRLNLVLKLNLTSCESLQVVNYGLGGFYAPHMDPFEKNPKIYSPESRATPAEIKEYEERTQDNRLATILIYLNKVEAGGSTIFNEIDLSAEPTMGSAIVWFNLRKNRSLDKRTRHMGCPVLVGSKWIATFWVREHGNVMLHPCGLNKDD